MQCFWVCADLDALTGERVVRHVILDGRTHAATLRTGADAAASRAAATHHSIRASTVRRANRSAAGI
jgi:hypothetical protein